MAVLTQGTEVFVLVPKEDTPTEREVLTVNSCITFNPGDESASDIDVTPLSERDTTHNMAGLITPGEASLGLNADPADPVHIRLYGLKRVPLMWAMGWSDGTAAPTVNADGTGFELPPSRTFNVFEGSIATFPFQVEGNSVVKTSISIKRKGAMAWNRKTT